MADDREDWWSKAGTPIIVALIGMVGVIAAAALTNWDKVFPHEPSVSVSTTTSAPAATAVPKARQPAAARVGLKTRGSLFIVTRADVEGASVGARVLNQLQAAGLQIASDRNGAKLLIEIDAPSVGQSQPAPINGLEGFSVVSAVSAKMSPRGDDKENTIPIQRQALGMGATEVEARRNSIVAASDRLAETIVDVLAAR